MRSKIWILLDMTFIIHFFCKMNVVILFSFFPFFQKETSVKSFVICLIFPK